MLAALTCTCLQFAALAHAHCRQPFRPHYLLLTFRRPQGTNSIAPSSYPHTLPLCHMLLPAFPALAPPSRQGMNVIRPSFYPHALAELAASLQRLAAKAAAGLQQLAGMDPQSSSVLTTGVGRFGKLMLVRGAVYLLCLRAGVCTLHCC